MSGVNLVTKWAFFRRACNINNAHTYSHTTVVSSIWQTLGTSPRHDDRVNHANGLYYCSVKLGLKPCQVLLPLCV